MGERAQLQTPIGRARLGVVQWLDGLPKEYKDEAVMALDKLCQVAEQQIEQAYFDGYNNRSGSERVRGLREAVRAADLQKEPV